MKRIVRAWRRTALLVAGLIAAAACWAQEADTPKKNYEEYLRDTSVPAVPAAALIGVEKSKIVEVSSVSKLSMNLTAADKAREDGTPFGIDLSPAMLLAERGGSLSRTVRADSYASDQLARILFRTRLSLAWAKRDNSRLSAWGIHTRPFDLRDPFVDRNLEACFQPYAAQYTGVWSRYATTTRRPIPAALKALAESPASAPPTQREALAKAALVEFTGAEGAALLQAWSLHVRHRLEEARPGRSPAELDRDFDVSIKPFESDLQAARSADEAALRRIAAVYAELEARAKAASALRDAELAPIAAQYKSCQTAATNRLWNRSYLAIGYSNGSAKTVDAAKPVDGDPGHAVWVTWVYGFEPLKSLWRGEAAWRDQGSRIDPKSLEQDPRDLSDQLERNARLTLHASRHSGATKRVSDVLTSADGRLLGIGFDYSDNDARRWSAQLTHSREGEGANRKSERTAVLGLDIKLQDSLWFGLSWGRRAAQQGDAEREVKAQVKWAFSDSSWLKP